MPPITPGSAVSVRWSSTRSSAATARDPFGHADAEVDHAAERQLERAAPRDQLSLVERQAAASLSGGTRISAAKAAL